MSNTGDGWCYRPFKLVLQPFPIWSQPLTSKQLQYAALDAAILLELYPILVKKLERSHLLKIAQLEYRDA